MPNLEKMQFPHYLYKESIALEFTKLSIISLTKILLRRINKNIKVGRGLQVISFFDFSNSDYFSSCLNDYYYNQSMNGQEIAFDFQQFFQSKKLTLDEINEALREIKRKSAFLPLIRKITLVCIICSYLNTYSKQAHMQLDRFRRSIFDQPFKGETSIKKRRPTSVRKKTSRLTQIKQIPLHEQLRVQSMEEGLKVVNQSIMIRTPLRQPIIVENFSKTEIPPFDIQTIMKIRQEEESALSSLKQNSNASFFYERKMKKYMNFLQVSVEKDVTKQSKVKRQRSDVKTLKKPVKMVKDEMINLKEQEENIQMLERLSTKIKSKKIISNFKYFTQDSHIEQCLPVNRDNEQVREQLRQKFKKLHQKNEPWQENMIDHQMIEYNYNHPQQNDESQFVSNQQGDSSITKVLQSKLQKIMDMRLYVQDKVQFEAFCIERGIKKEIKSQLFYQLLHMDYPLEQEQPQYMGPLLICKKNDIF